MIRNVNSSRLKFISLGGNKFNFSSHNKEKLKGYKTGHTGLLETLIVKKTLSAKTKFWVWNMRGSLKHSSSGLNRPFLALSLIHIFFVSEILIYHKSNIVYRQSVLGISRVPHWAFRHTRRVVLLLSRPSIPQGITLDTHLQRLNRPGSWKNDRLFWSWKNPFRIVNIAIFWICNCNKPAFLIFHVTQKYIWFIC